MIRSIIVLFLLLIFISCNNITNDKMLYEKEGLVYSKDENKIFSGTRLKYGDNNKIIIKGQYKKGIKNGEWRELLTKEIGKTRSHGMGLFIMRDFIHKGVYKAGKKEGKWTIYDVHNESIAFLENYKSNKLHGQRIRYNILGKEVGIETYEDGIKVNQNY